MIFGQVWGLTCVFAEQSCEIKFLILCTAGPGRVFGYPDAGLDVRDEEVEPLQSWNGTRLRYCRIVVGARGQRRTSCSGEMREAGV